MSRLDSRLDFARSTNSSIGIGTAPVIRLLLKLSKSRASMIVSPGSPQSKRALRSWLDTWAFKAGGVGVMSGSFSLMSAILSGIVFIEKELFNVLIAIAI